MYTVSMVSMQKPLSWHVLNAEQLKWNKTAEQRGLVGGALTSDQSCTVFDRFDSEDLPLDVAVWVL